MSRRILSQLLPLVLLLLICVPPQPGAATPAPAPAPVPDPGLTDLLGSLPIVGDVLKLVGNVGNAPPPTLLWTRNPSPQCAAINQGELLCCRGALAGDQPLVVFLAGVYGYKLNPNDVNGLVCDDQLDQCPGVRMCCQVTALNPLLSLFCQDYQENKAGNQTSG